MKIKYFYDGQIRRTLKHLIRLFGEFQVSAGYDQTTGEQKFKSVPCRYADISRMAAYMIAGNSENVMPVLPNITINIQSLTIDRQGMTAPAQSHTVMGTNQTPEVNEYTKELDEIWHVQKYNPVPWIMTFNVNICTTTTTAKLELFEQISSLFNPAVQLQTNDNPNDWSSVSEVELTDCIFSTRAFPQGTESDLDIMNLTFKTTVWLSLPAKVERAKLIQQIVTNIGSTADELDIELNSFSDIETEVFTPKNMCIKTKLHDKTTSSETYEITLVSKNMAETNANGAIYSWHNYLSYLKPNYSDINSGIKFQDGIEDPNALQGEIIEYTQEPNKILVKVDNSKYVVTYTIRDFITKTYDFSNSSPTDGYVNSTGTFMELFGTRINPNDIFYINNDSVNVIPAQGVLDYIYCSGNNTFYKYDDLDGWNKAIQPQYRQGYWRLTFKE